MKTLDEKWQYLGEQLAVAVAAEGFAPSAAERAFAAWLVEAEPRLRGSLHGLSARIDAESVLQEAALRMWEIAKAIAQGERAPIVGTNASLRFALRMTHNLALNMIRKVKREVLVDPMDGFDDDVTPSDSDGPDPLFHDLLWQCFELLTANPLRAIRVRVEQGHLPEGEQAKLAGMTRNTFHQNIRRARLQLAECLSDKGIELGGFA